MFKKNPVINLANQNRGCLLDQSERKFKPVVIWLTQRFPRLTTVTCFPALDQLHVFPRFLVQVTSFPALFGTGHQFPRAWHQFSEMAEKSSLTTELQSSWKCVYYRTRYLNEDTFLSSGASFVASKHYQ